MTKLQKMKLCDQLLMVAGLLILASGVQLEVAPDAPAAWVWVHMAVGILFFAGIGWHLWLHFKWGNWASKLMKQKHVATRWLAVFLLLTLISLIVATVHWLLLPAHSAIGGVHGKIAFVFVAICAGHTIRRLHSPVLRRKR